MADLMAERMEEVFAAGARGVAIDLLLPPAWSHSERFSAFVLRHQGALTLAAHLSPTGEVVGPEALQGLTAVALGQEATRELFGLVNVETDSDGVVRRAYAGYRNVSGRDQETWAARSVRKLLGSAFTPSVPRPGEPFWIDCSSLWKREERVAWKDVALRLQREPTFLSGALVLVGADIAGSGDEVHRIAVGPPVPGIVLQAMVADTILHGVPVRAATRAGPLGRLAAWLGLSGLVLGVSMARRPSAVAALGAGLALLYVLGAFSSFPFTRILVPVVLPVVQAAAAVLVGLLLARTLRPFPTP